MNPRGELAHSIRNPLAAIDANLRFLAEVCRDLQEAVGTGAASSRVRDGAPSVDNPPRLLREALEALDDSGQAVEQIRKRLNAWVEEAR